MTDSIKKLFMPASGKISVLRSAALSFFTIKRLFRVCLQFDWLGPLFLLDRVSKNQGQCSKSPGAIDTERQIHLDIPH